MPPTTETTTTPVSEQAALKQSGRQPPSYRDPDKQLRAAIELITEAFELKAQQQQSEVLHWKQVASQQKQQIVSMEADFSQTQRRLDEMEKTVASLQQDKRQLLQSKQQLVERYNQLRKNAMQLETFRRQIISMVEFSPQNVIIPDQPDTSFLDATGSVIPAAQPGVVIANTLQPPAGTSSSLPASVLPEKNSGKLIAAAVVKQPNAAATAASKQSIITSTNINMESQLETLHLTPFRTDQDDHTFGSLLIEDDSPLKQQQTGQAAAAATAAVYNDVSMDAPMLYKQIRNILSPGEFDKFATSIANFNTGTQTADETISQMQLLIKDDRLCGQMRRLIVKAVSETSMAR